MKPRSNSLFHFTNKEEFLFDIFKSGFWPRYCLEDIEWQGFKTHDFVAFPMVCFCDIPLSRISEHTGQYGSYGLGLTKTWAEKNNLNPILYLSPNSRLSESILESMNFAAKSCENIDDGDTNEQVDEARFLVAHIKPTSGKMLRGKKRIETDFYQESEWRNIPRTSEVLTHLSQSEFNNTKLLDKENDNTKKYCSLKVTPKDISYIFVPTDKDIPNVIKFIKTEMKSFKDEELMILYTKIVSIETLNGDM